MTIHKEGSDCDFSIREVTWDPDDRGADWVKLRIACPHIEHFVYLQDARDKENA